jgi:hypothetical protein
MTVRAQQFLTHATQKADAPEGRHPAATAIVTQNGKTATSALPTANVQQI